MKKQLEALLGQYEQQLQTTIRNTVLDREAVLTISMAFYADCRWWPASLKKMSERVTNKRLRRALHENYLCEVGEAGDGKPAHTDLAENYIASLGLTKKMRRPAYLLALGRAEDENDMLKCASEAKIAGFMLLTETHFAVMLEAIRPAIISNFPLAEMQYIDEHIAVDGDEHAVWMMEATLDILKSSPALLSEVVEGMEEAISGAIFPFNLAKQCATGVLAEELFFN